MSDYSAIAPGTDLSRYARDLVRMHDALLGGSTPAMQPRALVSRSWSRMVRLGLEADGQNTRQIRHLDQVEHLRRASLLRLVIDDLQRVIGSVADASLFLMVVTNADGVILWRSGASTVCRRADTLGFTEGALWTESTVGTNAIGTALAESAPVQLFSGEHFEQAQHPWYCTAYPVHDPRTGDLLGIVDVSGPALTLHPAIGALVESAVRLAEASLWRDHAQRLERLRTSTQALVAGVSGPVLVVDDDGWVAHSSGIATRDRVAAPQEAHTMTVTGMGLCLPERVTDGWLIRPSTSDRRMSATLHLGQDPSLEVNESWRTSLSRRHAQILHELHRAGSAGLTPRQLSAVLFGDGEHVVTVRAEISRLRRALGGVVASRPYRIADGVVLTIAESAMSGGGPTWPSTASS